MSDPRDCANDNYSSYYSLFHKIWKEWGTRLYTEFAKWQIKNVTGL